MWKKLVCLINYGRIYSCTMNELRKMLDNRVMYRRFSLELENNTSFFVQAKKARRSLNSISKLTNIEGEGNQSKEDIMSNSIEYFTKLFEKMSDRLEGCYKH